MPESSSARAEMVWVPRPEVIYVPTPHEVVAEMLNLADVGASDIVYDLGSGDGRIVISAALMGARGVGIELDPERIEWSRRNAARAGVSDRVEFLQEDIFDVDFSDATVVTLYLFPTVNLRLRPLLFQQLRPGTRIVCQTFHLGDWKPDEVSTVQGHDIFFWVIPINVSGHWDGKTTEIDGERKFQLQLMQEFQQVNGTLITGSTILPISRASLEGSRLLLTFGGNMVGRGEPAFFEGNINGDVMEGKMYGADGSTRQWKAVRREGTKTVLDRGD
jgi:SAM-dependent methyltransferase